MGHRRLETFMVCFELRWTLRILTLPSSSPRQTSAFMRVNAFRLKFAASERTSSRASVPYETSAVS